MWYTFVMDRVTDTKETTVDHQDWLIEKSDPYAEAWGDQDDANEED